MSTILGDLKVKLGLDSSDLKSGIAGAQSQLSGFSNAVSGVGRGASGLSGILNGALSSALGFASATVVMKGVGSAVTFAKGAMIGYNSTLQQAGIGFTTMLGSGEKAQGFLLQLKQFANTSPFELPDVLTGSQRLLAMGFNANEVIPLLKAVGNTAAAMGSGSAGINNMTLALGQMNASVVLHTQDLNQMIAAGVPAWDILSKATGKSTAQVKDAVENGQIASDVFIKAFNDYATHNFGGMMDAQSHTFAGAMSTIKDTANSAIAQGMKPFFDAIAKLADKIGQFVQTDKFQGWIAQVQFWSQRAVDAITNIAKAFQSGGISAGIHQILADFDNLTGNMFSAGWNLISTYTRGIVGAANSILRNAIDAISQTIASFFIGHSPPPEGPLSTIDQGGKTLMETYGAGMAQGLAPAQRAAQGVQAIFAQLDSSMSLPQAQVAFKNAAGNLEAMKAAGSAVDDQIARIDDKAADLQTKTTQLQRNVADITDAYNRQIDPLQKQVDALTNANDLTRQLRDDNLQLQDIQLQQAQLEAEGDPVKRAALATQIAQIQAQEQQRDLSKQIAQTQAQIAQAPLQAQQDALDQQEQEAQFAQRQASIDAARAKASAQDQQGALKLQKEALSLSQAQDKIDADKKAGKDTSAAVAKLKLAQQQYQLDLQNAANGTDDLAAKQAQLDLDKQRYDLKQKISSLNVPDTTVADLNLKLQELQAQQQMNGLQDTGKLAQIAGQQELLKGQEQKNQLDEQEQDTKNKILAIPLQKQINDLKAAQDATLKPLNDQITTYQRESDLLGDQRDKWAKIKSNIDDATSALQQQQSQQEAAQKKAAAEAKKAGKDAGPSFNLGAGEMRLPQQKISLVDPKQAEKEKAKLQQQGSEIGKRIGDGIKGYLKDNIGGIIGGGIGSIAGGALFGPIGALAGGLIGKMLGNGVETWLKQHGMLGDIGSVLKTEVARIKQGDFAGVARDIGSRLLDAIKGFFSGSGGANAGTGAIIGMAIFGPLGAVIGGLVGRILGPQIDQARHWLADNLFPKVEEMLPKLANLIQSVDTWILGTGLPMLVSTLGHWAGAFLDWIGPQIPGLLKALGNYEVSMTSWLFNTGLPLLISDLYHWGAALVDWIKPRIGPVLSALGELLKELGTWAINVAAPAIWDYVQKWGGKLVDWVGPRIGPMLNELGKLLTRLGEWIWNTALPEIGSHLLKWGEQFVSWVGPKIVPMLKELGSLLARLGGWINDTAAPAIQSKLEEWGKSFISWVAPKIPPLLKELGKLLLSLGDWILTTALPEIGAKLLKWGGAFLDWIKDTVLPKLGEKLGAILTSLGDWIQNSALPWVGQHLKDLGSAIVNAIWDGISSMASWFGGKLSGFISDAIPGPLKKVAGKALGLVPGFASGVTNFGGGLAVVGESGPELVRLPSGSDVIPNRQTTAMLANAGPQQVIIPIMLDGRQIEQFVVDVSTKTARRSY